MGRKSKAQIEAEREAQERARREEAKKAAEEKRRQQKEAAKDIFNTIKTSPHFTETIERFAKEINFHFYTLNFNWSTLKNSKSSSSEIHAILAPDREAAYALITSLSFLGITAEPILDKVEDKFLGVRIEDKEYLI